MRVLVGLAAPCGFFNDAGGKLVGQVAALGHLDGVNLADEVGDGDVRRGQLLAVAILRGQPGALGLIAFLGQPVATAPADGL